MDDCKNPEALLSRLDGLLAAADVPALPSYAEDLNDSNYTLQHEEFRELSSQRKKNMDYVVGKACHMLKSSPGPVFRICSIGCGDGTFDQKVLSGISEQFPSIKLQYMGVDVNEVSCQRARELLASLSNVEAEVLVRDIEQLAVADIKPFDLVIAVKILYYVNSLEAVLSNAIRMTKPSGLLVAIHVNDKLNAELLYRFWNREHKSQLWLSPSITQALDSLGVSYTRDSTAGVIDLTSCFMGGFQQPNHKRILDFMAHAKLSSYPPAIAETCIQYLSSIAYGKPEKFLIPHIADVLLIEGKAN
jgi:2-polyprenyl-3-methyl-5-hydroxy-6-metoxy-1,4-benzoquinol methylase